MAESMTVDERPTSLERELAELKRRLGFERPGEDWIQQMSGGFADNPVFDEIVRLGKELRDAEPLVDETRVDRCNHLASNALASPLRGRDR